ncbi:MAG: hypothetical protein KDA44_10995 [Planctomycetales bacterium]|nr:hypothetical protein [Planctomycetales bacterium]
MRWLALDIGGANLKVADGHGYAAVQAFALWRAPERLAVELARLIEKSPPCDAIAVTMTGELADGYSSRAAGVEAIVAAMREAAGGRNVVFYRTDGKFTAEFDPGDWLALAATNWRALAQWAIRLTGGESALLVDVGSTTVDIIPLVGNRVAAAGSDDYGRLRSGELVYTGVERTPLCALVEAVDLEGEICPVAAELFATTLDAYLVLGEASEDAENVGTADGRPRTRAAALTRLGRMVCREIDEAEAGTLAWQVRLAQLQKLEIAGRAVLDRMTASPEIVIVSGHGDFLASDLLERWDLGPGQVTAISLAAELGPDIARCAPAHALAVLAAETPPT